MFKGRDFISIKDLSIEEVNYLLEVAKKMEPYARREKITKVLDGAVLANLFFEPSTRTRISFAIAFNRLGGMVNDTTGFQFSSIVKGESIYDTAKVISSYADIITIRHPKTGTVSEFAKASSVPVVNGGDGVGEHPTQAMLDLYTIFKEKGRIENLTIAMVGDLKYGRTVHSLSLLLSLYKKITFIFISPKEIGMPEYIKEFVKKRGAKIIESENLIDSAKADIIYITRIQEERFPTKEEYDKYKNRYSINKNFVNKYCKKDVLLMHPLPRNNTLEKCELDNNLNESKNLIIFKQAFYGIPMRMAIFASIFGVENKVQKYEITKTW